MALVVKYADSLLKGFSTALSIVASCLVSYLFFEETQPSPQFVLGVLLVMISTVLYAVNPVDLYFSFSSCCSSTNCDGTPKLSFLFGAIEKQDKTEFIPLTEVRCDEEQEIEKLMNETIPRRNNL